MRIDYTHTTRHRVIIGKRVAKGQAPGQTIMLRVHI